MKRYGNLYQKFLSFDNFYAAFKKAFKGVRKTDTILKFYYYAEYEIELLRQELSNQTYRPGEYRYFKIYEPKERIIAVAPFRDRIVHHAIINILEPIYERCFIFDTYATRKEKGIHKAIKRVQQFQKNTYWYLKADIRKYFDSVDHEKLQIILERKLKDKELLNLLEIIISNGGNNGKCLPIGNLTSQFFGNVYLDPFDHFIKDQLRMKHYVRYMDDFVILSKAKEKLKELLKTVEKTLNDNLALTLKEKSVKINRNSLGLGFLGTNIYPNLVRIKRENLCRSIKKYRLRNYQYENGMIDDQQYAQCLASWNGYISSFDTFRLRQNLFYKGQPE